MTLKANRLYGFNMASKTNVHHAGVENGETFWHPQLTEKGLLNNFHNIIIMRLSKKL